MVASRDGFTGTINWRPVRELFRRYCQYVCHPESCLQRYFGFQGREP